MFSLIFISMNLVMVAYAINSSPQEADIGGSLSSRSTESSRTQKQANKETNTKSLITVMLAEWTTTVASVISTIGLMAIFRVSEFIKPIETYWKSMASFSYQLEVYNSSF